MLHLFFFTNGYLWRKGEGLISWDRMNAHEIYSRSVERVLSRPVIISPTFHGRNWFKVRLVGNTNHGFKELTGLHRKGNLLKSLLERDTTGCVRPMIRSNV